LHNGLKGFDVVDTVDIDIQLREPDGSIQYPYKNRFPNFDEVKNIAIAYSKGSVYSLERFDEIYNTDLFEKFIQYLQSNSINIYFYLPPYNPYTYDILVSDDKYKIINNVELYLNYFSSKHNIILIGSYNPHKHGFSNESFFDAMHSLDSVYIKLFTNLSTTSSSY